MDDLRIKLNREDGTAILPSSYTPTAAFQQAADRLAQAVISAEKKTGITMDAGIWYYKPFFMALNKDGKRLGIRAGEKLLSAEPPYEFEELEAMVLHEFGHAHYAPMKERFGRLDTYYRNLIQLQDSVRLWEANPEGFARGIIEHKQWTPEDFSKKMDAVISQMEQHCVSLSAVGNKARCATPEQLAEWYNESWKALQHGGKLAENPLKIYAELPEPKMEYEQMRLLHEMFWLGSSIERHLLKPASNKTAQEQSGNEQDQEKIKATMQNAATRIRTLHTCLVQPLLAEEICCDDFAIIHADDPQAAVRMEEKLEGAPEDALDYHPTRTFRVARANALAKEMVEAHERLAARAQQTASELPERPNSLTYPQWVHKCAEESQRMPKL